MPDTKCTHCQFHNLACYAVSKICWTVQYLVGNILLCNNISIIRRIMLLSESDLLLSCNKNSLGKNNILLSCINISLGENNVWLGANDKLLGASDKSLGTDDKSLGANDKLLRTKRNNLTATTITSRYLAPSIVSSKVSFKYRWYITIFVDYCLH